MAAWKSFKSIVRGFLGRKEENYPEIIQSLLQNYPKLDVIEIPLLRFTPQVLFRRTWSRL